MKSKKVLAFLLIIVMMTSILSLYSTVSAFESITPCWINTMSISCDMGFSGRTATLVADIDALTGATITGNLYLYKQNGTAWDLVTSWGKTSSTCTISFVQTYTVNSAGTYKITLTGMVERNGTIENVIITSNPKSCT